MSARISYVVLNYNGGAAVLECVESVLRQQGVQIECIVVDNQSTDGSVERIRERFPQVRLIVNAQNLGFADGMNVGTVASTGEFVVHVNQDIVLGEEYGQRAAALFYSDRTIGAVGGTMYRRAPGRRQRELDATGWFLRRRFAVQHVPLTGGVREVFGVSGACPVFRRSTLEAIRLSRGEYYDSHYFMYFEDIDVFFRLRLAGWKVLYDPQMSAWHYRSMSSGGVRRFYEKPLWIQRKHFRNRYLTIVKNVPVGLVPSLLPGLLMTEFGLIPYLLVRSPRSIPALVASWGMAAASMTRALRQRRGIQAKRTATTRNLRRFLGAL